MKKLEKPYVRIMITDEELTQDGDLQMPMLSKLYKQVKSRNKTPLGGHQESIETLGAPNDLERRNKSVIQQRPKDEKQ